MADWIAEYEALRASGGETPRARESVPEAVVQQFWYDHAAGAGELTTLEGHRLEVVSPGWWNHCAGPDFQGAQLKFNGTLFRGDVEVHIDQPAWKEHGHHADARYNNVLLHTVLNPPRPDFRVETEKGRAIPHLHLEALHPQNGQQWQPLPDAEEHPELVPRIHGSCNRFLAEGHPDTLWDFIRLSGDWRMLNKARRIEDRIAAAGVDQTAYEELCRALGYRPFTDQFKRLARALPFERAAQLAVQEPFLLEAALLHLAGFLPEADDAVAALPPHGQRLAALRAEHLPTLRALPLTWPLAGVRPNNYPCRRIAGLAAVVGRMARKGIARTLEEYWQEHEGAVTLRRAMEGLFPRPVGFWSRNYQFGGKTLENPQALVGTGRVRSIIGNVFVPLALASARMRGDQSWEERIFAYYRRLPMEPGNQVYGRMIPRVLGEPGRRFTFHLQQGLLQMHDDWCHSNPSCRNCPVLGYLDRRSSA